MVYVIIFFAIIFVLLWLAKHAAEEAVQNQGECHEQMTPEKEEYVERIRRMDESSRKKAEENQFARLLTNVETNRMIGLETVKIKEEHNQEIININESYRDQISRIKKTYEHRIAVIEESYKGEISNLKRKNAELKKKVDEDAFFSEITRSNLRAIPYMAAIMAEFETYGLEKLAKKLDWGSSTERLKKVKHIREIRKDAQAMVEKNKEAYYQLEYLLNMFPNLRDVIDAEYNTLPFIEVSDLSDYDATKEFLSKEEYEQLSVCERNQLALDRYRKSHNKTKWQIGRDYELYVGYRCELEGYNVDYFGSYKGIEDLGRDIIAKKGDTTLIIQCKYWSSKKQIHENHVNQLFGTMMCYCIENDVDKSKVKGVLVTNIELSDTAKKMAKMLEIEIVENFEAGDYPCIKCNINRDSYGIETKIYHLPFDQQYDATKIDQPGEFMAITVAEAEAAGFRRAFKWFGC